MRVLWGANHVKFPFPVAVCDIGGTNVRFALVKAPGSALESPIHLATAAYPGLEQAFAAATATFAEKPRSLIACAAGPIDGRKVTLTNAAWEIDGAGVAARTGLEQGLLFNDFEAQALSLPIVKPDWIKTIGPPVPARAGGAHLILGPGTGLGAAALLDVDGRYFGLASEAGHVSFGPIGAQEAALWPHLDMIQNGRVSAETILCGPGLVRLHRARLTSMGRLVPGMDAAALVDRAHAENDGEEARSVKLFSLLLARFAGDMALALMATGGVTFSGGILPRILDLIDPQKFRAHFEDKAPHGTLMRGIGTRLIVHEDNVLFGMGAIAAEPERYAIDYARRAWC